jgi:hypothetical protein
MVLNLTWIVLFYSNLINIVPQDYKIAVKKKDIVEKKMTPADLSTAQKLARECVRKKYKGC